MGKKIQIGSQILLWKVPRQKTVEQGLLSLQGQKVLCKNMYVVKLFRWKATDVFKHAKTQKYNFCNVFWEITYITL